MVGAPSRSTAPGSGDGAPATRGVREDLELASAPLRARQVERLPTGASMPPGIEPGLRPALHRSPIQSSLWINTESEENALSREEPPTARVLAGRD